MTPRRKQRRPLAHDTRVLLMTLGAGLPAVALAILLLWTSPHEAKTRWTLATLVTVAWVVTSFAVRDRVTRPLQTLAQVSEPQQRQAIQDIDSVVSSPGSFKSQGLFLHYRRCIFVALGCSGHQFVDFSSLCLGHWRDPGWFAPDVATLGFVLGLCSIPIVIFSRPIVISSSACPAGTLCCLWQPGQS